MKREVQIQEASTATKMELGTWISMMGKMLAKLSRVRLGPFSSAILRPRCRSRSWRCRHDGRKAKVGGCDAESCSDYHMVKFDHDPPFLQTSGHVNIIDSLDGWYTAGHFWHVKCTRRRHEWSAIMGGVRMGPKGTDPERAPVCEPDC